MVHGPGTSPCPGNSSVLPPGAKCPVQSPEDQAHTNTPRAMIGPLPSTPSTKSRQGAVPAVVPPLATPALSKDSLPPPPPSPGQKSGSGFWTSISGPPTSRPGSFTFPGEAGEISVRQNSNQIQTGSGSQTHRHSTHSKEADRMSTCSSASEQSIQSTQSNGVRLPSVSPTNMAAEGSLVCPVSPAAASSTNLSLHLHCPPASSSLTLDSSWRQACSEPLWRISVISLQLFASKAVSRFLNSDQACTNI